MIGTVSLHWQSLVLVGRRREFFVPWDSGGLNDDHLVF